MKKYRQEETKKTHKKTVYFVTLGVIILSVFLVAQVWLANRFSTYGEKIQDLSNKKTSLALENRILESKIADRSSLLRVEDSAVKLGFVKISNIQYLKPVTLAEAK